MSQGVRSDKLDGEVVRLTLDAPNRNALTSTLVEELARQLEAVEAERPSVVALASAGPVFCAGFDLAEPLDDRGAARRFAAIQAILERLRRAPFATVACVAGAAYGAGADLVAACDYRLATGAARFRFPGSRFGIVLGVRRLADVVGAEAARDIVLRAAVLDAGEAHEHGLVTHLLEEPEMTAFATGLGHQIADLDHETLAAILDATRSPGTGSDAELLLRSAHRSGLAARIAAYAGERTAARTRTSGTGAS